MARAPEHRAGGGEQPEERDRRAEDGHESAPLPDHRRVGDEHPIQWHPQEHGHQRQHRQHPERTPDPSPGDLLRPIELIRPQVLPHHGEQGSGRPPDGHVDQVNEPLPHPIGGHHRGAVACHQAHQYHEPQGGAGEADGVWSPHHQDLLDPPPARQQPPAPQPYPHPSGGKEPHPDQGRHPPRGHRGISCSGHP